MNTNHSSAKLTYDYQPTIIESRLLIRRLAIQLAFLKNELKRGWVDFKIDPVAFTRRSTRNLFSTLKKFVSTPNAVYACATALMAVTCVVLILFVVQSARSPIGDVKFVPAMKNGHAVSVHMQLEYNFNLY